ncbi:MAG: DUF4340 domain-containing protein [Gammaproteobacteria bacterium]|nr:DUF4340 domain-containing protein [Gammaproteobacteria bacterium]NNJ48876.1 DUF4340 domain-containing protein [Gammaproteobacteria bacterium]
MNKNNILNLVLFIVVICLASVIYFSEEISTELDRLSTIDIAEISSIEIRHNSNTTTIEKQADGHWQITRPVNIAANDFRIKSVLELVNAPVHSTYSVNEIDLARTGLEQPVTRIRLNELDIAFGNVNPATELRYLRLGDSIYTIEDVYYPLLSSHFGTLVSLNLLAKDSRIEKLILLNQTISQDEKGFWQSNIAISADRINETIDHWQHGQAFGVHSYLEREQLGEVFIYLQDKPQPVSFLITDTDPWLVLARPEIGLEYHLDIEAYNNLIIPQ